MVKTLSRGKGERRRGQNEAGCRRRRRRRRGRKKKKIAGDGRKAGKEGGRSRQHRKLPEGG
jgi:hypothetical protein